MDKKEYKGIKAVKAGQKRYYTDAKLCVNPRGVEYYWLGKIQMSFEKDKNSNTDIEAVKNGFASLTPITLNMTEEKEIPNLQNWIED